MDKRKGRRPYATRSPRAVDAPPVAALSVETKPWVGLAGACEYLGVSRSSLYRLIRRGLITPFYVETDKPLFLLADLFEFVNRCARRQLGRDAA